MDALMEPDAFLCWQVNVMSRNPTHGLAARERADGSGQPVATEEEETERHRRLDS